MLYKSSEKTEASARVRNTVRSRLEEYGVQVEKPEAVRNGAATRVFDIIVKSDDLGEKALLHFLSDLEILYNGDKYELEVSIVGAGDLENIAHYKSEVVQTLP